jgi:hypothetical protein
MKTIIILLIIFSTGLLNAQVSKTQISAKQKIIKNLKKIEDSYINNLDFTERRKAIKLVNEIIELLENQSIVNKHKKYVLSDEAFEILKAQVEETIIESKKTDIILSIGKKGFITTNQLLQLLQTYDFNVEKMNCIKKIYSSIADKVNVNILLTTISSELSKDELIKFFNSQ